MIFIKFTSCAYASIYMYGEYVCIKQHKIQNERRKTDSNECISLAHYTLHTTDWFGIVLLLLLLDAHVSALVCVFFDISIRTKTLTTSPKKYTVRNISKIYKIYWEIRLSICSIIHAHNCSPSTIPTNSSCTAPMTEPAIVTIAKHYVYSISSLAVLFFPPSKKKL